VNDDGMRVTFLGTGTSHGIPVIGCDCVVCQSTDPRNKRLRPSILVEDSQTVVLVDATPDLRTQALRANLRRLDAVLLTHTHADHILGLDDVRAFTERQAIRMPIYGSAATIARIAEIFPYACTEKPTWPGLPQFELRAVEAGREFEIGNLKIRPLPVPHGRMMVFAFVFGDEAAYVTDCNAVPQDVVQQLHGVPVLVLDGLRHRPHPTHLAIDEAVNVVEKIKPKLALLTHMNHEVDHQTTEKTLPANVRLAYDGMQIEVIDGECKQVD
jgi:phosphoribosyl 1,2-cyclic phosphate phosphodiesterase